MHHMDTAIAEAWRGIVRTLGRRLGIAVQPIEFSLDWYDIRCCIKEGLAGTGHRRYVTWYGAPRYMRRMRDLEEDDFTIDN
jgi:hypothetical protein